MSECSTVTQTGRSQVRAHGHIESYAFSRRTPAQTLAEVGACVRLELVIRTANLGTAGKLLFGKLPSREARRIACPALRAADSQAWLLEEADAFVAANSRPCEQERTWCVAQSPGAT